MRIHGCDSFRSLRSAGPPTGSPYAEALALALFLIVLYHVHVSGAFVRLGSFSRRQWWELERGIAWVRDLCG